MSRSSFHLAPLAIALGLALGAISAQAQTAASALAAAPVEISIVSQPLAQALDALARQTRMELMVQPTLVTGKTAPAVAGRLAPREALNRVLAGSGLVANIEGSVVTIQRAPAPPPSTDAATPAAQSLASVTVTAAAERSPSTELTGSYTTRATTIGKLEQSLRETPQSVTVVTRQQMDDQNLTSMDQVLAHTTGTTASQRNFGSHTFAIRGFALSDSNYLVDGVQASVSSPTGWMPLDMAIYDRVEVLRGAGGLVVGAGDPSGAVNLVRKRPRAEGHFDVTASIGSWNNFRTEVDAGGAFNADRTVRGRIVAAYQDRDHFYDVQHSKLPLLYGIIDADLTASTRATFGLRHQEVSATGYMVNGLPRYTNGGSLGLPRSTWLSQNWGRHDVEMNDVFAEVEHRFNDDWKAKVTLNHSENTISQAFAFPRGAINRTTRLGSVYAAYFRNGDITSDGIDANVNGKFEAFGGRHQLAAGVSFSKLHDLTAVRQVNGQGPVNVFNPNPSQIAEPAPAPYPTRQDTRTEQKSVYASSRWQLAEPLHLLLGGRITSLDYKSVNAISGARISDYEQKNEFTPYAGLTFDLNKQWSVYGSYADIFQPQSGYLTASGAPLDPAIGANYEAGVKGELYDGRLNVSAAIFRIQRTGIATVDTANLGACPTSLLSVDCYVNGNKSRSKGVEFEASGEVSPGWQVAAGYTHVMSRGSDGESLSSETPHHLLRVSTNYRLPGDLNAWTVGGGLSAQSAYSTTISGVRMNEPGRAVWDVSTSYRINRQWTAALRVANLFDRNYYAMIGSTDRGNWYGEPRSVTLTLRGSF